MTEYHKYVPTVSRVGHLHLPNGKSIDFDDTRFFKILFGGDQLTVARARGAQSLRATHDSAKERLEGLCPVIEDWYARMTLMKVYTDTCGGNCWSCYDVHCACCKIYPIAATPVCRHLVCVYIGACVNCVTLVMMTPWVSDYPFMHVCMYTHRLYGRGCTQQNQLKKRALCIH